MYLANHASRPNQIDFVYISSISRSVNFFGNYYIGCSDGSKQKSILDVESMILSYGSTCIQTNTTSNIFPLNAAEIINITNIAPNNTIYLPLRFSALEMNVDLGGTFVVSNQYFTTCTISTNGFVYFGLKENNNLFILCLLYGGGLGLLLYGMFNATNYGIFTNYNYKIALMDSFWGFTIFTISSYLFFSIKHIIYVKSK